MNTLLPVVAVAMAALAALLCRSRLHPSRPSLVAIVAAALLVPLGAYLASRYGGPGQTSGVAVGLSLGMLATLCGSWFGSGEARPVALASGVAGASLVGLLREPALSPGLFAYIAAAGLGAILFSGEGAALASVAGASIATAAALGRFVASPDAPSGAPILVGIGGVLAALSFVMLGGQGQLARFRAFAPFAVLAIVGWLTAKFWLNDSESLACVSLGLLAALVTHWLISPTEREEPLRIGIAAVLWIGLATIVFGLGRTFGVGLAAASAALLLISLGNTRALLTLGPLAGVALYRLFRGVHVDASRALELSQHYAIVGLLTGAVLPLLPSDWRRAREGAQAVIGAWLWAILLAATPAMLAIVIGAKGVVGFVVGLSLAPLWAAREDTPTARPLALSMSIAGVATLSYGWLESVIDLSRDEKVKIFTWIAVALLVVGAILAVLSRPTQTEQHS